MDERTLHALAPVVLRLGLAALYLWFGLSQLLSPEAWTIWVPAWAVSLLALDAQTVVLLNGGLETAAGAFLAFGIFARYAALLLALHVFIIIVDMGATAIGVRDFAIALSTLALALGGSDWLSLDRNLRP